MAQEEDGKHLTSTHLAITTRHKLAYPALALVLSYLVPGSILLLYVLSWSWDVWGHPYTYDYEVVFEPYIYWTSQVAFLIGTGIACFSGYAVLWFRKPKWNVHFIAVFSWFSIIFGIGFSIWILLLAFVIPTGYYFWDGPSGGGSGRIYDPPIRLLISVPILGAGIYGERVASWIRRHPSLAFPSDLRDQPNHFSKVQWLSSGLAVVVALSVVFGFLLNPALSPMTYVHDRDGDGIADRFDRFPDDPTLWEPTGFWIRVTESAYAFNLTILETYTDNLMPSADFFVSVTHTNGIAELHRKQLSDVESGTAYNGVRFYDVSGPGFIDKGDIFVFDRMVYEERSVFLLSDSRGEVHYLEWALAPTP
jgi:hypothetical protein